MKSAVIKRSIIISGHQTSVSLEDEFWHCLKQIGRGRKTTLSDLIGGIDTRRSHGNLSSAIRVFVLDYFRAQVPGPSVVGGSTNRSASNAGGDELRIPKAHQSIDITPGMIAVTRERCEK